MSDLASPSQTQALPIEAIATAASVLQVASSPSRLAILWLLGPGDRSVPELYEALGQQPSAVSRMLTALRHTGLVDRIRHGRSASYRLTPRGRDLLGAITVGMSS